MPVRLERALWNGHEMLFGYTLVAAAVNAAFPLALAVAIGVLLLK